MIASLPMYAFPATEAAEARLWAGIRDRLREAGIDAPEHLTPAPGDLMAHWTYPKLLLSQTCGRPYKAHLHGKVQLVGTPDYGVEGCPRAHYRSLVVARTDDPRTELSAFGGARFAFNDPGSQSGWAALAAEAPEVLDGPRLESGSHRASVRAVREGRADFAAIDAVTYRHLASASETAGLRIIHATAPRPGLPLITGAANDPAQIFDAAHAAIAALSPADRARLGLIGLARIPAEDYLALPDP
jgi:ABC-type phosphate/phosphonate transport system substrate-binding protein